MATGDGIIAAPPSLESSSLDPLHVLPASSSTAARSLATSIPALTASFSVVSGFSSHLPPPPVTPPAPSTMVGWIGWIFSFIFQVIPSVLYWIVTFTTITLPTWLFTLFSMSLTFTMNFTTL